MAPTEARDPRLDILYGELADVKAQALRVRLSDLLVRLALLVLVLTVGYAVWYGRPIHYIQEGGPGYSLPGVLPEELARDYATRFVEARYTFIPSTFKEQTERCLRWVHPELQVRFRAEAADEERVVRKYDMKTQVFLEKADVVKGRPDTALVRLKGLRSVWVGETYREEIFQAEITLIPLLPKGVVASWGKPERPGRLVVARTAYSPVLSPHQP